MPVCDHDENTSEWTEISADTLPGMEEAESSGGYTVELEEGGRYFLGSDIEANILVSHSATLCLNGHTLTGAGAEIVLKYSFTYT